MAKGLGKGINALFNNVDANEETVQNIAIKEIKPNPYQPRKIFDAKAINELRDSIKIHGVLQPIILRNTEKGYEIVVGERRYRAAKEAKLKEIPAVVRDLTEEEMMELSVIENLQREDLSPLEEAESYQFLMKKLSLTQAKLAERVGKSRPYIANFVRLLTLPEEVQVMLRDGSLSAGHGRVLLGLKLKKNIIPTAKKAVAQGLTVRQLEDVVNNLNENVSRETIKPARVPIFIRESESQLRDKFGTAVSIKRRDKKGKIEIEFLSDDDLDRILEILDIQFDDE
ncbi:ParB/RepB/Spo0J family partition protein [Listeria cossartiae subsp. cayugensis]|uniref:ParB/RepB/Spo0J family partition protein n=1 Tax=Listeria cossartiae subsp. cayugensis TaxID=2713505 RepID=A0ABU2IPY1_9LIST|nr:ParB/RepB/Spo0J family partition protein [Listeria cossartiae]MDT0050251.1 ParB/RepB/Spo0J family partition protein [Listeria cossartiae subsp. cayugensis]MDT0066703.1 ParB/RepB/Spo0J family partition protein [Listeria cossartiae subsp. cayugensis]MDT0080642.1 ParB/RepB/Spo0J family partition protein [Listeria cossartiae subsp. cayugensis]MDT0082922.1 ParB/RepB/Spo0J family partition protein [Listeria cossartiae subsp. cayugensis]MDT0088986.1 ParB/RepB/Spo0J family partition protein [Lister